MQYIQRGDIINPLGDGGTLENNFASFIFGIPIDTAFGPYETMAFIGIIPVLFAIIALILGDRDITVPSFYAIVFSLVWADGGRTLVSSVHLLPLVSSFRNAGRIFGAIMPIVLLLSVYGVYIVQDRLRKGELFGVSEDQKKSIFYSVGILAAVKVLEVPWAAIPSLEAVLAIVLVFGLILLVYLNRASFFNLQCYFTIALLINILILVKNFNVMNGEVLFKGLAIAVILVVALLAFNRNELDKNWMKELFFLILLIVGIMVLIIGNTSVLKPSDPMLDQSPALKVIAKIQEYPETNPQIWVYETGWPIRHMDFTYWFIKNNIHPIRAYFSYYPTTTPPLSLKIGNMDYFIADYIIDTAYLENGNQNIPEFTFKVDNISVYQPDHILPNAFVVRTEQLIPAKIEKFSPDEVVLSGPFLQGDVAVLKTAFYPGWKVTNRDASNVGNMVGTQLSSETSSVTFKFDPLEVKVGAIFSGIGILVVFALITKRREIEKYLNEPDKKTVQVRFNKKKKR